MDFNQRPTDFYQSVCARPEVGLTSGSGAKIYVCKLCGWPGMNRPAVLSSSRSGPDPDSAAQSAARVSCGFGARPLLKLTRFVKVLDLAPWRSRNCATAVKPGCRHLLEGMSGGSSFCVW